MFSFPTRKFLEVAYCSKNDLARREFTSVTESGHGDMQHTCSLTMLRRAYSYQTSQDERLSIKVWTNITEPYNRARR